ncbi:ribonuclease T2-like protein [Mycena rosella]|uniref:Ribonuclease T2-like n=1 Tax=Mycena rosella TaxID=1033263 RepID=A0AAD7CYI3_MYCRO|nr:ribonuclease T2-like protein [Mycena rosella]
MVNSGFSGYAEGDVSPARFTFTWLRVVESSLSAKNTHFSITVTKGPHDELVDFVALLLPEAMLSIAGLLALAGFSTASIVKNFTSSNINVNRGIISELSSGCPTTGTASCGTPAGTNTCCFETPGGLLLQTQFWDTSPSTGPSNSWTIHGLWPDECNLSFQENCDSSRAYTGISTAYGPGRQLDPQLHEYRFWKNDPNDGSDEELWEHEWETHGTCMSTLDVSCLPSGSPKGAEAVAFFETVVGLFQTLPTYEWLANQGITPSSSTTHTLASLTAAIKAEYGFTPSFDCDGSDLSGASYYFHLIGSVIDGKFVPINAPESGSCGSTGIKYLTKTGSPVTTTSTSTTTKSTSTTTTKTTSGGGGSTGTPIPLPATAFIQASTGGGLLTLGTWSTQTLATMHLTGTSNSFTMVSSKGMYWNCGASGGELTCGSGVSLGTFTAVQSGSQLLLASGGSTAFSSDGVPSGSTVFPVFTGSSHAQAYTLAIVAT